MVFAYCTLREVPQQIILLMLSADSVSIALCSMFISVRHTTYKSNTTESDDEHHGTDRN